jgi:hypothetical protein
MGKFKAAPGLDDMVALMVAPEVRVVADDVRDTAKKLAPQTKTWVTRGDNRVRDTHREVKASGFNRDVPDNLRFYLRTMDWDANDEESNHLPPQTWMHYPRDKTSRAVVNILECRCHVRRFHKLRNKIRTMPTQVVGPSVRIRVQVTGNRVVESEFGEKYTGPPPDEPGLRWMGKAASAAAARGRARR